MAAGEEIDTGRRVFRIECASCHTLDGYQGIRRVLPGPVWLFQVLLVIGLATVGWNLQRVISSPATGADAA